MRQLIQNISSGRITSGLYKITAGFSVSYVRLLTIRKLRPSPTATWTSGGGLRLIASRKAVFRGQKRPWKITLIFSRTAQVNSWLCSRNPEIRMDAWTFHAWKHTDGLLRLSKTVQKYHWQIIKYFKEFYKVTYIQCTWILSSSISRLVINRNISI